jgi:hypothetical protein
MATLRGEPVDRPAVCFYEINGYDEHPGSDDPYHIYTHPSWWPLIELARERSDRTVMRSVPFLDAPPDPLEERTERQVEERDRARWTTTRIRLDGCTLTGGTRRDGDVNTVWTVEHPLKSADDLRALLTLPAPSFGGTPDIDEVLRVERDLGDTGIVMIDTPDPLCQAAALFSMADYTVIALTEPALFTGLLEWFAARLLPQVEAVARVLPGRLWRIVGPEYASPPYLPPRLFREYVVRYDRPMVAAIQRHGGFARLHCHGRLRAILDDIAATDCLALDPIEPPPQGDVGLGYVRERYGQQMALFGNLEASDLENLDERAFGDKVRQALDEGTRGSGRGLVLMPSACPYGRVLSARALRNYQVMLDEAERC